MLSGSQSLNSLSPVNPGILRHSTSTPDPNHSDSSSPASDSAPCSPVTVSAAQTRPSSLHGLKHKHKLGVKTGKNLHSPSRRKSVGHIPLSPLARTPSPSPIPPISPTRSPSPLALPLVGHYIPGASNTTQTYSPLGHSAASLTPNSAAAKKSFNRPKSAEPGSPLLRRALSPDRLHPRSADHSGKKIHLASLHPTSDCEHHAQNDPDDHPASDNRGQSVAFKSASHVPIFDVVADLCHHIRIRHGSIARCGSAQTCQTKSESAHHPGRRPGRRSRSHVLDRLDAQLGVVARHLSIKAQARIPSGEELGPRTGRI